MCGVQMKMKNPYFTNLHYKLYTSDLFYNSDDQIYLHIWVNMSQTDTVKTGIVSVHMTLCLQ